MANQAVLNRAEDYDSDIFEFSSHAGARPKCAIDQGKFVSTKGRSGVVKDVYGTEYAYIPIGHTSYGEPDGILGINCGHHWSPVIAGHFVKRSEETKDFAANDAKYKESQTQRRLERQVRKDKTTVKALESSGIEHEQASVKLNNDTARLKAFCNETGRTYRADRTQVGAYNKSASQRANEAVKRAKARQLLPKKADLPDFDLQDALSCGTISLPKGTAMYKVKTIAGDGTSVILRDSTRLARTYGGDYWKWQKNVATVELDGEKVYLHFYEYDGKIHEAKIKE